MLASDCECSTPQDSCGNFSAADAGVDCILGYEALIKALGGSGSVSEREGSRVRIELGGEVWRCHRPHPGREAKRYQIEEARELLERAGIKP